MKSKTVQEALAFVSRHPITTSAPIDLPVWELVARQLFEKAYTVGGTKQTQKDANTAQKMIFDRLVGKRRTGTHPAVTSEEKGVLDDWTKPAGEVDA
mgnify:CR=1 FL=1